MCVCVYMCVYVCVYVCVYACVYVCMCMYPSWPSFPCAIRLYLDVLFCSVEADDDPESDQSKPKWALKNHAKWKVWTLVMRVWNN